MDGGRSRGGNETTVSLVAGQYHAAQRDVIRTFERAKSYMCMNGDREAWVEFIKCMNLYVEGMVKKRDTSQAISTALAALSPELVEKMNKLLTQNVIEIFRVLKEIDFQWTSMQDDLRDSPSYQVLTYHPPQLKGSAVYGATLNSALVSQPIFSEGSNFFRHSKKTQFEETLFFSEDEQSEMDLVLESNCSAAQGLAELELVHGELSTGTRIRERRFVSESIFFSIQLSALVRVFGGHIQDILDCLDSYPAAVFPLMIRRLRQEGSYWYLLRTNESNRHNENLLRVHTSRAFHFDLISHGTLDSLLSRSSPSSVKLSRYRPELMPMTKNNASATKQLTAVMRRQVHDTSLHQILLDLFICSIESSSQQVRTSSVLDFFNASILPFFGKPSETLYDLGPVSKKSKPDNDICTNFKLWKAMTDTPQKSARSFFGAREAYVFFRTYHILLERIELAQTLSASPFSRYSTTPLSAESKVNTFEVFLSLLRGLVDGSLHKTGYETFCTQSLGTSGYVLFDLDRLIAQTAKALQIWMERTKGSNEWSVMDASIFSLRCQDMPNDQSSVDIDIIHPEAMQ